MDKIDESYGSRSAGLITQIPRVRISRSNLTLDGNCVWLVYYTVEDVFAAFVGVARVVRAGPEGDAGAHGVDAGDRARRAVWPQLP